MGNNNQLLPKKSLFTKFESFLALTQTRIKIYSCTFDHYVFVQKKTQKIFAIAQTDCQPRPNSARTLDASSNYIYWDI